MAKRKQHHTKKPMRARISEVLSLPPSIVSGVPYMELQGDTSLAVTGYESLLLYEEENILFRMHDPTNPRFTLLRITGEHLVLCVVRDGCLRVTGQIHAVILHPGGFGIGL